MNKCQISILEIQIVPIKPQNGLIAFASAVINNQFYISNIAVYTSPSAKDGYRLVYPDKILPNGKRVNCFHPINQEAGEKIKNAIISKFKELMEKVINGNEKINSCL